jgi:hypothetical protein
MITIGTFDLYRMRLGRRCALRERSFGDLEEYGEDAPTAIVDLVLDNI